LLINSSKNRQLAVEDLMYRPFGFRYLWTNYFCLASLTKSQLDISNILVWGRIVNMYTFRDITRGTDRLPALGGLASFYLRRAKPDEEYLAGLWRNDFTPRAYRAPSWSWASVDAIITYFGRYDLQSWRCLVSKIVIRDVCCKLKGINPFGQVVDGFAVVTGPAVDLDMEIAPDKELDHCSCFLSHGQQGTKKRFNSDVPLAPTRVKKASSIPLTARRARSWSRSLRRDNSFRVLVLALHISTRAKDTRSEHSGLPPIRSDETFLILGMSPDMPGTYERLGVHVVEESTLQDDHNGRSWTQLASLRTVKII
jgi:hypothetical protein